MNDLNPITISLLQMAVDNTHDLSRRVCANMDKHLANLVHDRLLKMKAYPEREIFESKYALLSSTYMFEKTESCWRAFNSNSVPNDVLQRKKSAEEKKSFYGEKMRAFKEAADKLESLDALPQDKNANRELVLKQFAITQEQIAISLEYARFLYEYGLYSESARVSGLAIRLVEDPQKLLNFLWGKLAAQIMNGDFSKAATTVISLKDMIESRSSIPATLALQHRSWLLHWSLFVFFDPQCTSGVDGLIDLYLNPTFTNALQTASPYLLRYLCIAILVSARRETLIKDLVKLVQSELYQYRDPFTDFVYALQSECDFAQASSKFVEAKKLFERDVFISHLLPQYAENARFLLFKMLCRVYNKIELSTLVGMLNFAEFEECQNWVTANLAKSTIKASLENTILLVTQNDRKAVSHVAERTKELIAKTKPTLAIEQIQ